MENTKVTLNIHQSLHAHEKYSVLVSTVLVGLFVLFPVSNDFFFIHNTVLLVITIGFRIGTAALMWLYYFAYRTRKMAVLYQIIIPLEAFFAFGVCVMLDLTRPRTYVFSSIPVFAIVSFYYFMMYSPLPYKIIPALVISAEQIAVLIFYKELSPQGELSLLITLIVFNVFGISAAWVSTTLWKIAIEQERGLRRDIQFKDALVNASFEALILYRSNRIVDCNPAFLELSGLDMDAVRSVPVDHLLPLSDDQLVKLADHETVPTVLRGADPIAVELRRRDMTMANFEYHSLIIRKSDGAELAALQKLGSHRELDPLIERLPLSKRERQIVHDITTGLTRGEIADHLFISEETVKKHTANVYLKLRVNSKIDLINRIMEQ